ncbi:hypothetical protein PHLCEN_2v547 [Hermanssonia centrifuga]|uniref:Uncharacterized protein n=1 Tax=Hermanssonia centrifuga TaxID=98765 RepID=A0A2R6S5P6_9APHY|nr:hypothetical protein PHLCEN_2v547 [Hermanssonia centrifuga]
MVKIIKSRQPTRRELIQKERVQKAAAVSVDQHGQDAEDPLLVPSSTPGSLGAASNTARRGRNFIRPRAHKSGGIRNPVKIPAHSPRQSPVIVHRKAVFSDSSSG